MPELPDVTVYIEALEARIKGETLDAVHVSSPFVLRSFDPPLSAAHGRRVLGLRRIGKRIVFELEGELFLVIHLMIAGRFQWKKSAGRIGLATFQFSSGTLVLTEAGTKKRASLHLVAGEAALRALDPGGLEVFECSLERFKTALREENHTIKRSLTDPHLFSGIGNAYSDEILHRARISPVKWTSRLTDDEIERLFNATREVMREWIDRLRADAKGGFPEKVTAFRTGMAVHGRYRQPCPACQTPIQRIAHGEHEMNYCPRCQTEGKLLADRALSRILKGDWPRTIDEWEQHVSERRSADRT